VGRILELVMVLALAGILGAGLEGCYACSEIDKAMQAPGVNQAPPRSAAAPADAPQAAAAPGQPGAKPAAPAGPIGLDWWKTATTLGQKPSDATIGRCKLGDRVEFMRRDDCTGRGGTPE
jgi:hypothetical protein